MDFEFEKVDIDQRCLIVITQCCEEIRPRLSVHLQLIKTPVYVSLKKYTG
jgi:hypothetical protein